MWCIEFRRVKAVWNRASNKKPIELVLDDGKIEEMKKRRLSLLILRGPYSAVVLIDIYGSDEHVYRYKSLTPLNDILSEYLSVLVRRDI